MDIDWLEVDFNNFDNTCCNLKMIFFNFKINSSKATNLNFALESSLYKSFKEKNKEKKYQTTHPFN